MRLSSQMTLLMSFIFVMIFTGNFIISINNIKSYLELESLSHAQDTATSLGLSISPYSNNPNDPIIETMMNAIFDRGYYKEIIYLDSSGKKMIHLENKQIFTSVPKWFKDLIYIDGARASSRLSNGWIFGGTIQVTSNPGYAYFKLYEQTKDALIYALVAFTAAMALLLLFVKLLLQPLKRIEQLASQIAKGRFETIKKLPWTVEVKNVAKAMNFMSKKLEGVISKLDKNISKINQKLKQDQLTGLDLKPSFITSLKEHFMEKSEGYVIFAKIDDLANFAKEHNGQEVEELILGFSRLLNQYAKEEKNIQIYRFFGAEFAIIFLGDKKQLEAWFKAFKLNALPLSKSFNKEVLFHMGAVAFNAVSDLSSTLAGADEAYEQAMIVGPNAYVIKEDSTSTRNMDDWHKLVTGMIDKKSIDIDLIGNYRSLSDNHIFMKEVFTKVVDDQGKTIPIGTFVSLAEKYEKITDLDKSVIQKVLSYLNQHDQNLELAVNISIDTVKEASFKTWLFDHLNKIPSIAEKIVFTLTAYSGAKDIEALASFSDFVHRLGAKVMIKRFESHTIALESLKKLDLDYIRLSRDYTQEVHSHTDKQAFVEGIQELGDLLHIRIIAESVKTEDLSILKRIGIFGLDS